MNDWTPVTLSSLIEIKHGFAFKGDYFYNEPPGDFLLTPGNFAIGGGFQWGKKKYYRGPVPEEYVLAAGDLLVTMTDLSKEADTLGYSALVPEWSAFAPQSATWKGHSQEQPDNHGFYALDNALTRLSERDISKLYGFDG